MTARICCRIYGVTYRHSLWSEQAGAWTRTMARFGAREWWRE
jgi:hypothetical protein